MDRAIEVWESEGGAHKPVASNVPQSLRRHQPLWIGVLYVITIVAVLAFVALLN